MLVRFFLRVFFCCWWYITTNQTPTTTQASKQANSVSSFSRHHYYYYCCQPFFFSSAPSLLICRSRRRPASFRHGKRKYFLAQIFPRNKRPPLFLSLYLPWSPFSIAWVTCLWLELRDILHEEETPKLPPNRAVQENLGPSLTRTLLPLLSCHPVTCQLHTYTRSWSLKISDSFSLRSTWSPLAISNMK